MKLRGFFWIFLILFVGTTIIYSADQTSLTPQPSSTPAITPTSVPSQDAVAPNPPKSPGIYKIAFFSFRDRNNKLYVMNEDGSGQLCLTKDKVLGYNLIWSPDGTRIIYQNEKDRKIMVWAVNVDGTNPVCLSNDSDYREVPSWSPDGTKVLCITKEGKGDKKGIFMVSADGKEAVRITGKDTEASSPTWSPDGTKILCLLKREGDWGIYLLNPDGRIYSTLTKDKGSYWSPTWSPDGKRIAYFYKKPGLALLGKKEGLYVMDAEGNSQTWLVDCVNFYWSPDGTSIAYIAIGQSELLSSKPVTIISLLPASKGQDVETIKTKVGTYIIDVTDGKPVKIAEAETTNDYPRNDPQGKFLKDQDRIDYHFKKNEENARRIYPVWSPDSKSLAYMDGSQLNIWYRLNGTVTRIGLQFPWNDPPAWSPDGKTIACVNFTGLFSKSSIFIIKGDYQPIKITNNTYDSKPVWSPVPFTAIPAK